MINRRHLLAAGFLPLANFQFAHAKPALTEAREHHAGVNVAEYLVSEKLDGVRAYWDGSSLLFRSGQSIAAPAWFTQALPKVQLDGELWLGRQRFDELSGIVRKAAPVDAQWKTVSYQVFDLPGHAARFAQRAAALADLVKAAQLPFLQAVAQERIKDEAALQAKLKAVVTAGGEGLMLHRANALHAPGRNGALLKLKPVADAEATVMAHVPGKGKHAGQLGALHVKTAEGISFKLGTGFSDAQRANPPAVGSVVTYTYRDKTPGGKPRFAAFLRVRDLP
jgi:DNA ligase 1